MAGSKTVKKTAEYTKRFEERYDELKWLYCELYNNNMGAFDWLCDSLYGYYQERNTELKKLKLDKEQVSHENKMEIIPEQPSREEIGEQNISLQKDQPVQPTDKEISDINQGISKTLKTPVQSNPNDINKKEDAFTFAKTNPFIYITFKNSL